MELLWPEGTLCPLVENHVPLVLTAYYLVFLKASPKLFLKAYPKLDHRTHFGFHSVLGVLKVAQSHFSTKPLN